MTLKLSENIRTFRKARGLTQEQLAEAMGVSVAAVSKWETGASSPDLSLLVALAEFFEASVDALLGYACQEGSLERAIQELQECAHAKRYDEGMARAEGLVVKYPNSFRLVHAAASLYHAAGYERRDARAIRRAIELYRRACVLVEQNTDPRIGVISLQNEIALLEVELGEYEQAIEHLKANNLDCINDDRIGFIYAVHLRDADKALPYLSETLMENIFSLYRMAVGFANAFSLKGRSAEGLEILRWLYGLLEGLTTSRVGPLDKYQSTVLLLCAETCVELQNPQAARDYLGQALVRARRFDADPSYRMTDLRFYHGDPGHTVYDNIGLTAVQALHNGLLQDPEGNAALLRMWEELIAQ